jgi:hypothetical protein
VTFGEDLARALGLNPWKVSSITLRVGADEEPAVLVLFKPTEAEQRATRRMLKRYVIVELPEDAEGA